MVERSQLANIYWRIRNARGYEVKRIRTYYRQAEREKKRLIESGVSSELVRLYCRFLANPRNPRAKRAFDNFSRQQELDLLPLVSEYDLT